MSDLDQLLDSMKMKGSGSDKPAAGALAAVPPIPAGMDPDVARILRPMREALLQLPETIRDTAVAGLGGQATSISPDVLVGAGVDPGAIKPSSPPGRPSGFQAQGAMTTIILSWNKQPDNVLAEVWTAAADDMTQAVLVERTASAIYSHSLGTNATRFYWLRFYQGGLAGDWHAQAGLKASTGNIDPVLDQLKGGGITSDMIKALDATKLMGSLKDWQIEGINAGKLLGQLQSQQIASLEASKITGQLSESQVKTVSDGLRSTMAANKATADKQMATLADADKALSLRIDTVTATANTDRTSAQAGINEAKAAAADAKQSSAQSIGNLTARLGAAESSVSTIQQAQTALDGKVSSKWGVVLEATADGRSKLSGAQAFNDGKVSKFVITADQVLISSGENLIPDPNYYQLEWWGRPGAGIEESTAAGWARSRRRIGLDSGVQNESISQKFVLEPNATYRLEVDVYGNYAKGSLQVDLHVPGVWWWSFGGGGHDVPLVQEQLGPRTYSCTVKIPNSIAYNWGQIRIKHAIQSGNYIIGLITVTRVSGTTLIEDGAITTEKVQANAVTADKIAANNITARHIVAGQINTDHLAAGAVTAVKIAASSVTTDKLAASSITAVNLAAGAVTTDKLASNSITTDKLAANSVTAANLAAGAISADKLASKSITADKLAVGSLDAITARIGTLRTATSGARTEISDNVYKVFDENGTLRVRMGNLSL